MPGPMTIYIKETLDVNREFYTEMYSRLRCCRI